MAVLTDAQRRQVWRGLMRWWSALREPVANITKDDLLAAVATTDQWIEDNQAAYNSALPTAARASLTQEQKTVLFCAVAARRVGLDFARRLFREVN